MGLRIPGGFYRPCIKKKRELKIKKFFIFDEKVTTVFSTNTTLYVIEGLSKFKYLLLLVLIVTISIKVLSFDRKIVVYYTLKVTHFIMS